MTDTRIAQAINRAKAFGVRELRQALQQKRLNTSGNRWEVLARHVVAEVLGEDATEFDIALLGQCEEYLRHLPSEERRQVLYSGEADNRREECIRFLREKHNVGEEGEGVVRDVCAIADKLQEWLERKRRRGLTAESEDVTRELLDVFVDLRTKGTCRAKKELDLDEEVKVELGFGMDEVRSLPHDKLVEVLEVRGYELDNADVRQAPVEGHRSSLMRAEYEKQENEGHVRKNMTRLFDKWRRQVTLRKQTDLGTLVSASLLEFSERLEEAKLEQWLDWATELGLTHDGLDPLDFLLDGDVIEKKVKQELAKVKAAKAVTIDDIHNRLPTLEGMLVAAAQEVTLVLLAAASQSSTSAFVCSTPECPLVMCKDSPLHSATSSAEIREIGVRIDGVFTWGERLDDIEERESSSAIPGNSVNIVYHAAAEGAEEGSSSLLSQVVRLLTAFWQGSRSRTSFGRRLPKAITSRRCTWSTAWKRCTISTWTAIN